MTDQLVIDDRAQGLFRVHRSAFKSQEIFDQERKRIFERFWLYLGHESEVDKPGDFVKRTRLGRPLIFLRNIDGLIDAFYDTCTHRGTMLCRTDRGNAKRFQCMYHAWTFDTLGKLIALPDEDGYGPNFDREDRSLRRPPRLEGYRGFWFVSFNPDVEDLYTYLDGARDFIDLILDQSEDGMRVIDGTNLYATNANWKLLAENSFDTYHGLPLHQTYFAYIKSLGGGISTTNLVGRGPVQLGHGHAVVEGEAPYGRPIAKWDNLFGEDAREDIASIRRRLDERWGAERARRMSETARNMVIFPNLVINDISAITVRYFEPVRPDYFITEAWALAPREENTERLARRIDSYLTFIGPGGFATPDDIEAFEVSQLGYEAYEGAPWNDVSRGMTRMPQMLDELQIRVWWRAWTAALAKEPLPGPVALPETPLHTAQLVG